MTSPNAERMLFCLRSQMFFAAISAVPGVFITLIVAYTVFVGASSLAGVGYSLNVSLLALGWLGYAILAIYLFVQWIVIGRSRAFQRLRGARGFLSILLWVVPFLSFVVVCVRCCLAANDGKPDVFNDVELNMHEFAAYAAMVALWFFIPAIFAILAHVQARTA